MARLYTNLFWLSLFLSLSSLLEKIPFLPTFTFSRNEHSRSLILSSRNHFEKSGGDRFDKCQQCWLKIREDERSCTTYMHIMECNNLGISFPFLSPFLFFFNRFGGNPARYIARDKVRFVEMQKVLSKGTGWISRVMNVKTKMEPRDYNLTFDRLYRAGNHLWITAVSFLFCVSSLNDC